MVSPIARDPGIQHQQRDILIGHKIKYFAMKKGFEDHDNFERKLLEV